MKRLLNYLFLASLSLSISCNHLSNSAQADYSNVTQIQYDDKAENVIAIDKIVDRCSFVRLETGESNLIGRIDQILICDSLIVVVDQHVAKAIFVFNHDGKFLNRISRLGNGHGEYLLINHVAINDKKEVCILDNIKERLIKFNISGELVASQDLPFKSAKFEFLGNDNILFDVETCSPLDASVEDDVEKSCYLLTDLDFNIKYTFGKDHSYKNPSFRRYSEAFLKTDGRVYGRLHLGNTIFEFDTDSVKARYELSLKNGVLYAPSIEDLSSDLYSEKRLKEPSFSGCFLLCKDYSCYKMMFPERVRLYTWFFMSNKTGNILTLSTESDDPVLSRFNNPLARWSDNTLVQDLSPTTLLALKEDILSKSMVENPEVLFDGLSLEDNPVLFFYTFNPDKVDK